MVDAAFSSDEPGGVEKPPGSCPNGMAHTPDVEEESLAMEEAARHPKNDDPNCLYLDLRPFMDRAPVTVR
jgi:hypothetical protein